MSQAIAEYITSNYRRACEHNDFAARDALYATAAPFVPPSELDKIEMDVAQAKGRKAAAARSAYWRTVKSAQMARPLNA